MNTAVRAALGIVQAYPNQRVLDADLYSNTTPFFSAWHIVRKRRLLYLPRVLMHVELANDTCCLDKQDLGRGSFSMLTGGFPKFELLGSSKMGIYSCVKGGGGVINAIRGPQS